MNARELLDLFRSGKAYVACDGEALIADDVARAADQLAESALKLQAAAEANDGSTPLTDALVEIDKREDNLVAHNHMLDHARSLEQRCTGLAAEVVRLTKGIASVDTLIAESRGVIGLHLNGDEAPWSELLPPGRYSEWLADFDTARAGK